MRRNVVATLSIYRILRLRKMLNISRSLLFPTSLTTCWECFASKACKRCGGASSLPPFACRFLRLRRKAYHSRVAPLRTKLYSLVRVFCKQSLQKMRRPESPKVLPLRGTPLQNKSFDCIAPPYACRFLR
jgi:hypothetical protein